MGLSQDPCFTPVGVMQEVLRFCRLTLLAGTVTFCGPLECNFARPFVSLSLSLSLQTKQSTIWAVRHLPQNRDVFGTSGGGNLNIWK